MAKTQLTDFHKIAQQSPALIVTEILNDKGIERSLARQRQKGQSELLQSNLLPQKIIPENGQAALENAGVKFSDQAKSNQFFRSAEIPQNWQKIADDEATKIIILDHLQRPRANIFYDAAFCSREAKLEVLTRYSFNLFKLDRCFITHLLDCGVQKQTIGGSISFAFEAEKARAAKNAEQEAQKWLNQNYPEWQNVAAYWD